MDIISLFSWTIFAATIITIVMALMSYSAFKLREWRKPRLFDGLHVSSSHDRLNEGETLFFKKYVLPPEESGDETD